MDSQWVYDKAKIKQVNRTGECICKGDELDPTGILSGRWICMFDFCRSCGRNYAVKDGQFVSASEILTTNSSGVVPIDRTNIAAFELLMEMDREVKEYIEFGPRHADDAVLYAKGGEYIGALLYNHGMLMGMVINERKRGNGHGKEFIETWFERIPEDVLKVSGGGYAREFYESLDIDTNII